MANYYESTRTNYFKVKDATAFQSFIQKFGGIDLVVQEKTGHYALLFDSESSVPCFYYDEEKDDDVEIDFMHELSRHLCDDSIAVIMGAGAEKLRFINGYAYAINSKGEQVELNLAHIYKLARDKFGEKAEITLAEY
jgi:hypothetical protein